MAQADEERVAQILRRRRDDLPVSSDVPPDRGVYEIWLSGQGWSEIQSAELPLPPGVDGALYVGVGTGGGGLRRRFREEWRPRNSGRSSPRRTLGALLSQRLGLDPGPRPDADRERGARYYMFRGEGERLLTEWLVQHCSFAAVTQEEIRSLTALELVTLETRLIRYLRPPLNIAKVPPSPTTLALKELRRKMSAKAIRAVLP